MELNFVSINHLGQIQSVKKVTEAAKKDTENVKVVATDIKKDTNDIKQYTENIKKDMEIVKKRQQKLEKDVTQIKEHVTKNPVKNSEGSNFSELYLFVFCFL